MPKRSFPTNPSTKKKYHQGNQKNTIRPADQKLGKHTIEEEVQRPVWAGFEVNTSKLSRFSEKNYNQLLESFYLHPFFRTDIARLRKWYPKNFWNQISKWQGKANKLSSTVRQGLSASNTWKTLMKDPKFFILRPPSVELAINSDIENLCFDWGLFYPQDREWIKWLIQNWEAELSDSKSPEVPENCKPVLYSWTQKISWGMDPRKKQSIPSRVELLFRPGISKKEAQKVARESVELLGSPPTLKGRPTLLKQELQKISELIPIFHSSKLRSRCKTVDQIQKQMKSEGFTTSRSVIDKVYRDWLRKKGLAIKTYKR